MDSRLGLAGVRGFDVENIFHSISDYVSIHDRDFRVVRGNAALYTFLGQSEEEIAGRHCYMIFNRGDNPCPRCPQVRMFKEKRPVTELIEDENIGIPLLVTCSPIYDEEGELIGSVHIARNVSKEQQQMREAAETIAELRKTLAWLKGMDGILSICSSCKNVRNQDGEWERIEKFISDSSGVLFSHGMCPDCFRKLFPGVAGRNAGS